MSNEYDDVTLPEGIQKVLKLMDPSDQLTTMNSESVYQKNYESVASMTKVRMTVSELLAELETMSEVDIVSLLPHMIERAGGKMLQGCSHTLFLHLILNDLGVYDPGLRTKLVTHCQYIFQRRFGQFAKEKNELVNKMRELVLEYDNLLRAESIMNTLEKEAR